MQDREKVTRTAQELVTEINKFLDTLPEKSLQTVYYFVRRLAYNYQRDNPSP